MVPQFGNNFAKAYTPALPSSQVGFTIQPASTTDTVSPATTNVAPQTITVHGETLGDSHQVAASLGAVAATGEELQISVKLKKTVKVALHAIILQKGDNYGPTPTTPTAQQAQDYLNQVYGPQTNTYFTVTRKDYALDYDMGGAGAAVDGKFDFSPVQPFTDEQMVIENSYAKDYGVDYNVYFLHTYHDSTGDTVGHAVSGLNAAYIQDYSANTAVVTVLAHELGHLMGLVHAEIAIPGFNKAYLPGTDPTIRLMYGGIVGGPHPNPKVLVKAEWDIIAASSPKK